MGLKRYALTNCEIFTGDQCLSHYAVVIEGRKIAALIKNSLLDNAIETIDLQGQSVAPGFFDLQVNGGGGVLFNDEPSLAAIETIFRAHKKCGTTDFLPTFITGSHTLMAKAAKAVKNCPEHALASVRGIHFEGPFISLSKLGVHDSKYARDINAADMAIVTAAGEGVTLLTLAPERVSPESIAELRRAGIIVSLGHTNATCELAKRAFGSGATGVTHLYNAMSPLTARQPGLVGAVFDSPDVYAGIIVDGHHVDFASVRIAHNLLGGGKLFLVTDAMPPACTAGTEAAQSAFELGPHRISVSDGRCVTSDGVLAGSALDMATAVRNCVQEVGIDKAEALRMASTYPANYVGLGDTIGRIEKGYDANLVIFDKDIRVAGVVVQGVFESFCGTD